MTPKHITTSHSVVACDVCGRTLLRGEHADIFLHSGQRRMVCELCTARAVHEGWIREGLDDATGRRPRERRGRGFLERLRQRRPEPADDPYAVPPPELDPQYAEPVPAEPVWDDEPAPPAPPTPVVPDPGIHAPRAPVHSHAASAAPAGAPREHRNVHAVPTNAELKVARAIELFNAGPHPRTVAGISRSLGAPVVAARPSATEGSVVSIVVAWELSWYRYEVDLGDEAAGVRVVAQGSEMSELPPEDQVPNAAADERGELHPVAALS